MDLSQWREDYNKYNLKEKDLCDTPFELFSQWFQKASEDNNPEPNAMVLSTVAEDKPQARIVLLKEIEDRKFVFYTNYQSNKGKELEINPNAQLLFLWIFSQRQVRISGKVSKLPRAKAIAYFDSRPIDSKISAIASPQSQKITMSELLERVDEVGATSDLTCPEHWGGYALDAVEFEFWQGQSGRLHDRIVYKKREGDKWEIFRLAP
jgi:pyridoxamine 5'-phosphate oxidase